MRCLPEKGVLEEDGTPFYHVRQTYLRPDQLQRLKECGVVIKKGLFDADEDRKIQRNWEYYAKENGLPLDAAYEYAGGYSVEKKNAGEQLEHVRQLHSTRLVPIMCRGLNNRTGMQVMGRMRQLFRPKNEEVIIRRTGKILWTKEAEEELKSLLKRGFSAKQIQHLMGITISSIVHHMRKLGLDEDPASSNLPLKELTPLQKAYLFRIVSSGWLGKRCRLCATLKIALEFAISKDFEERMKQVDFGSMCGKLGMTLSQIKGCWLREAKRLRQTYEEFGRNAMKVYAKYNLPLRRISVDEWQRVLEICREQNVDSIYDFDKTLVHERMMKEGLTGFYTSGLKEGAFVINKIGWSVNRARVQCEKDIPAVRKLSFNGWIEILMKYNRSTHCNFDGVTRFMTKGNIFILKSIVVKYLRKIGVPLEEIPNYETLAKGISRKFQRFDNVSDVTDSEDPFNEDNIDNSTFIEKAEEKNEPTEVIDTFEEEPNSAGEFFKNSRCAGSESEDSASLVSVQCRDEIPHEERFSKSSGPGVERADNTKRVAELLGEGSSSGGEVHRKSGNVNSVQEGEVVEIQQINEEEEVKNCVGNDKPKRKCPKKTIKEEKRNDYKEVILKEVLSDDKPATNFKRRHNILESEFPSRLETAAEEVRSAERKRLKKLKKHRKKHLYDEVEVLRGNECASVDVDVSVDVLEDGQLIENKTTKWEEDPQNSTNDGIARVKKNINNMEENIESWVKLYEAQSVNEDDGNTTESERRRLKKLKKERKRLLKEHSSEAVVEDGDVKVHNRDEEELLLAAHETANALVTSVTEDDELDGKRLKRLRKAERKRLRMEEVLNGTVENESADIQGDTVERSQHELKECSSKHTLHESAAIDEEKLEKRILKKLKRNNKKFDDDAVPKIEVEATAIRSECSEKQKDEGEAAVNELISIDAEAKKRRRKKLEKEQERFERERIDQENMITEGTYGKEFSYKEKKKSHGAKEGEDVGRGSCDEVTEDVQHDRKRKKRKRKEEETEYGIHANEQERLEREGVGQENMITEGTYGKEFSYKEKKKTHGAKEGEDVGRGSCDEVTEDVQHDRKRKKRKRKEEETEYDIYASKPEQPVSEEDETLNGLLRMLRRAKQKGRESKAARLQQLLKEHEEYLRRKNYLSEGQKGDDDVDVVLSSGGKGDRRKGCRKN